MARKNALSLMLPVVLLAAGCQESDFDLDTFDSTSAEADIRYCRFLDPSMLKVEADTLLQVFSENIEVSVSIDADLTDITPYFVLNDGASIFMQGEDGEWNVPADGVSRDCSAGPLEYMVVSPNGKSHHLYTLGFNCKEVATDFHFEYSELKNSNPSARPNYYIWKEFDASGDYRFTWATGNAGYSMSRGSALPEDYPTSPCEGVNSGKGVKLTTCSTGPFGERLGMPIAAGNIFLGEFDVSNALIDACASTLFGVPFSSKPLKLRGYMSYKPALDFRGPDNKPVENMADSCDIYAVLYRNVDSKGQSIMLNGHDIMSSPNIVAMARIDDKLAAGTDGEWVYFEVGFDYETYGNNLSMDILKEYGYNLTFVASSSRGGAEFYGAVGSVLMLDEVEIVCDVVDDTEDVQVPSTQSDRKF